MNWGNDVSLLTYREIVANFRMRPFNRLGFQETLIFRPRCFTSAHRLNLRCAEARMRFS